MENSRGRDSVWVCEDGHPRGVGVCPAGGRRCSRVVRRRPTLPRGPPRSTIGAVGLSFRVRNGTGRFPDAMTAETLWRCNQLNAPTPPAAAGGRGRSYLGNRTVDAEHATKDVCQVIGLLVPVSSMHYCTSTSGLSTQSSSWEPLGEHPMETSSRSVLPA